MTDLPATRVRYVVVAYVATLAVILYIDRICISQAAPSIVKDLGLTPKELGYVFSAFTFAYALFEIPGGWLADRFGVRKVLTRIVVWWSIFTAATGWVTGFRSLVAVRFLFGAGEAGCFPNTAKAYSVWLPPDERSRAQSILWICCRWGGALTPSLVVFVLQFTTWRRAFGIFGLLGIMWAVAFYFWYRDNPRDHRGVNAAERSLLAQNEGRASRHGDVPWGTFLSARATWLLWLQYFCYAYSWYFYITWLPTYLLKQHGQGLAQGFLAALAGLPLFLGGMGSFCAGFACPALARRIGGLRRARRLLAGGGFLVAASLLLFPPRLSDPVRIMILLGVASFFADMVLPCSWDSCIDLAGRFSGTYSGSMNMMGNIGGTVGPLAVGYILTWFPNNWGATFYVASAVYFLGALCWVFIDPVTPLDPGEAAPPAERT